MHPALTHLRSISLTNKRSIIVGVAAVIVGGAAIAADQSKDQPPYNYGATQQAAPAPVQAAPKTEQAPAQPEQQPDGRKFNFRQIHPPSRNEPDYVPPKQEQKLKPKPEAKQKRKQVAHKPSRRPFNYDTHFIDRNKIRRCIKELPWRGLLKDRDSPEGRRAFCETYQIELWVNQDQKRVKERLKDIFEGKPKPKPKPQQPEMPSMGY